jgi:hypothetical protein
MDKNKPPQNQLNVDLPEEIASGIYSNLAIITHSNAEFIVDFLNALPGMPKAKVKSRVILTPSHAKRLYKALRENIAKFEQVHGEIREGEPEAFPINMGPAGMA